MYNHISSRLRKPSKGFDPISKSHEKKYFRPLYEASFLLQFIN
jgi:hypothetical protein